MVYADVDGHIGYQAAGKIPVRSPDHSGDYPAPGWDRRYDWTGETSRSAALPDGARPAEGFIVSANQAVTEAGYRYDLNGSVDYGQRAQRIRDELEQRGVLSVADMNELQLDTADPFAAELVPYLLDVDAGGPYYAGGQELLEEWDFVHDADSAAASYYNAVWARLLEYTFTDQLPTSVLVEGGNRWFEVVRSHPRRPHRRVVGRRGHRGARGARRHRAPGGAAGPRRPGPAAVTTDRRVDLGPPAHAEPGEPDRRAERPRAGGGAVQPRALGGVGVLRVVNATGWTADEGFEVTWVPSMRMVVSLADLDDSTWVNLTGASGHAFHEHYTDQTDLWATGRPAAGSSAPRRSRRRPRTSSCWSRSPGRAD